MKVFDCFTFFNELNLPELRLKLLNEQILNAMTQRKDIFNQPGAMFKFYSPYWYPSFPWKIM